MSERILKVILILIALLVAAILVIPFTAEAQTAIYRSVKNTTSAIATGSGNDLTVDNSTSTATFASALPDSVGVGCMLQYDDDNDGDIDVNDSIVAIHSRISSTVFTVKTAAGAAPTSTAAADQDWSIFHAYTTLANCEAGTENTGIDVDIRAFDTGNRNISSGVNNEQWHIAIYRGNAAVFDFNGWTTGTTDDGNYIRIFAPILTTDVGVSQRHNGVFTTSRAHILISGTSNLIQSGSQYRFEGVQISSSGGGFPINVLSSASMKIRVSECIFKGGGLGIFFQVGAAGSRGYIKNSLFYDQTSGANDAGVSILDADYTVYIYNSTFATLRQGIDRDGGTVIVKNVLTKCNGADFVGTFDAASTNNASADATAPGSNNRINQTFTFVDEAGDDYSIASGDAGAKDFGVDLSGDANLPVTTDIIGTTRPQGSAFDIGAFEAAATDSPVLKRRRNPVQ